jgi:hypothetical protein
LQARLAVDRLQHQGGVTQITIPELELRAKPHGAGEGLLRGHLHATLRPSASGNFELSWDSPQRRLNVQNFNLGFSAQGLRLLPARLRRMLDSRVAGIGIDGRLQGHFEMLFPQDRSRWHGRGDLRLSGDRDGDVYLLDAAERRIGLPLLRDTRWRFQRIDRINWRRRYALGDFSLDTLLNFAALLPSGGRVDAEPVLPAYGAGEQLLLPYEIQGLMHHYNNQPWDPRGFQNRIEDYLQTLCLRDPDCRSSRSRGGRP